MAELILVVSQKTGIKKLFKPVELSTFPGSIAYDATPASDPRDAAHDYTRKFMNSGIYGTWVTWGIDTQAPTNCTEEVCTCKDAPCYHGFKTYKVRESSLLRSA